MIKRFLLATLIGSLLSSGVCLAGRAVPRLAPEVEAQAVMLSFSDQTAGDVFEAISETTGVKFIFDDKTDLARPLNIDLGSLSLGKALDMLMLQTKNFYKPLDSNTLLIAPDTRQKRQEYEDQVIRTFHLAHANSRQVVTLLRSLLQSRQLFESSEKNTVTIKDVSEKVEIAAKLVEAADREPGEVVVEFELLEVPKGRVQSVDDGLDTSIRDDPGTVSLAHPQLRIINGREGSIFIGDTVPLPTNMACPSDEQSAEPTTTVSYENVGIGIEVVPRINDDRNVTLRLEIGISSLTSAASPSGADGGPTISRRQLETTMRLADGETHIVSSLPALDLSAGGLCSADSDTELILLVTPRVTREPQVAPEDLLPYWVGTEENMKS